MHQHGNLPTDLLKDKVRNYFTKRFEFTGEELDAILDSSEFKEHPKGTLLQQPGDVFRQSYLVLQGCLRQYLSTDGNLRTLHFFTEEQWVLSMETGAATSFLVCEEDCVLLSGDASKELSLSERFPRIGKYARQIVEEEFFSQQKEYQRHLSAGPEERYVYLIEHRPDLLQRLPQHLIASYLGIQPESLSRIRKRMAGK
ncbi:MAG: Crp/Fnr family transcriptional regulator [Cytophagaceae bacterium]|jgi:CRP-like cAMP-binding protein|nr:Crp/Fnr family transcriptional regulator [Cytophagaceae bacterium]